MNNISFEQLRTLIQTYHVPFFDTPFFNSYLKDKVDSYMAEENDYNKYVIFGQAYSLITTSYQIHKIWNDVPNDYYRTHLSMLEGYIQMKFFNEETVVNWVRENMNYATFFNMLSQGMDKNDLETINTLLRDTFNPILKILQRGQTVPRPSRWRLKEFHDHMSNVYLELTTKNVSFPEKSITQPYVEDKYKIYQPDDTLSLAKWAAQVHNCVASYSDRVFRKQSEIVFVEENGTPRYTVEIEYGPLSKGFVQIKQIQESCKGMGTLQEDKRHECQKMIERAVGLHR